MKQFIYALGILALVLSGAACNNSDDLAESRGLGKTIPELEEKQATGTIIGSYTNGFGSRLVQVDEEYPIGTSLDIPPGGYHRSSIKNDTDQIVTYTNVIQVQWNIPFENGERVSLLFPTRLFTASLKKET